MWQKMVFCRVPFAIIHAVKNAKKILPSPTQSVIKPAPHGLGGDLAGITRADCCDNIRINNSRFEAVYLPIKFQAIGRIKMRWQVCQRKCLLREGALVGQIMDS